MLLPPSGRCWPKAPVQENAASGSNGLPVVQVGGRERLLDTCDLNRCTQHSNLLIKRRSVANEIQDEDILFR